MPKTPVLQLPVRISRQSLKNAIHMAHELCANFVEGECVMPGKPCKLDKAQRCGYFEKCILPLSKTMACWAEAGREYRYGLDVNPQRTTPIRRCGCGVVLLKRERMCDVCQAKKHRITQRKAQRKWRRRGVEQLSPKPEL